MAETASKIPMMDRVKLAAACLVLVTTMLALLLVIGQVVFPALRP